MNVMEKHRGRVIPATSTHYINELKKNGLWYGKNIVDEHIPPQIIKLVSQEIVKEYQVIPVGIDGETLVLVTGQSKTLIVAEQLIELVGRPIQLKVADQENVMQAIIHYYEVTPMERTHLFVVSPEEDEEEELRESEYSPISARVNAIFLDALKFRASDILIHPTDNGSNVLFEIDGRLIDYSSSHPIAKREKKAIVNVIKNKCQPPMDSANDLVADGGSFLMNSNGSVVDFRVSTMPTIRGQKVVIRVLDSKRVALDLDRLGFSKEEQRQMDVALLRTSGLFIDSGPTGHGKSTTIHAVLKRFNGLESTTITIEDPVEYKDETLTQIQVRDSDTEKLRFDTKTIFKDVLRQTPDNIFTGEIRDEEDAINAIRAAQSGHRVLTTVHADDVVTTLDRLFDLDIKRSSLLSKLNCIVSQRLILKLCPHCAVTAPIDEEKAILLTPEERNILESGTLKKAGPGCPKCYHGYDGRTVVPEIVVFDNALRDFFRQDRGLCEILEHLRSTKNFMTMWEKGLVLVERGIVNFSDLVSVITPNT